MSITKLTKETTTEQTVGVKYQSESSDRALSIKQSVRSQGSVVVTMTDKFGDDTSIVIKKDDFENMVDTLTLSDVL